MIFFRADGNSEIGIGHIMRCVTIAKEIIKKGEDVLFVTSDHNMDSFLLENGLNVESLDGDYSRPIDEVDKLIHLIKEKNASAICVDSYFVTQNYFQKLSGYTNIIYIDDFGREAFDVDFLINYNIQASKQDYDNLYKNQNTKMVLGLEFVPLREMFRNSKNNIDANQVKDILVSTGGADPQNISFDILRYWKSLGQKYEDIRLHIVCGPLYKCREEIEKEGKNQKNIVLHFNEKNMSGLMDNCQLAIASTGSTIYELCAKGIPTIAFYFVDNQKKVYEAFVEKTPVLGAGDYSADKETSLKTIFDDVDNLIDNKELRKEISNKMNKLVDGEGASRIADIILKGIK